MAANATPTEHARLVNAREAAAMLGVSVYTVRRAVREGELRALRFRRRGHLRFRVADLEEIVSGRPQDAVDHP